MLYDIGMNKQHSHVCGKTVKNIHFDKDKEVKNLEIEKKK